MFCKVMRRFSANQKALLTVSLIGRSSVGKSSLFNKLQTGENTALTSNKKNITRDRMEAYSEMFTVPVRFVDTAGIENVALQKLDSPLQQKMLTQTLDAVEYSDLALLVVDGKHGLTSQDFQIATWLRKLLKIQQPNPQLVGQLKDLQIRSNIKNAILVANKCENMEMNQDFDSQLRRFGLGAPVYVSAFDGTGFQDLLARIEQLIPQGKREEYQDMKESRKARYQVLKDQIRKEVQDQIAAQGIEFNIKQWEREFDQANPRPEENSDLDDDSLNPLYKGAVIQEKGGVSSENIQRRHPIMLAIMGRQNVGKSSLVNTLLGYNRVIADDTPGTTRDPISTQWSFKGQRIQLVDTAGIMKRGKEGLDDFDLQIQSKTRYIMRFAHVIIVLIDSLGALREMDLDLLQEVSTEGRAVILAVNKWDMVEQEYKPRILKYLRRQLDRSLGEIPECVMIPISAEKQVNIDMLMDNVLKLYDRWNTRISTGLLNEWLEKFKKIQSLPSEEGEKLKIRFIAQVKVRPPTFAVFINQGSLFKSNYLKFLRRKLSEEFDIEGVPVRIVMRDIEYQKERKVLERKHDSTVKDELLKKRKISKLAKEKLEALREARKKKREEQEQRS